MEFINKGSGIYTLKKDDNNFLNVCPERGGIITNWISNNQSILYFDQERFIDTTKSIRGGIPILFPICGNLENNSLFGNKYIDLMQHGFARDLNWDCSFNKINNSLCLSLSDNNLTRKYYPFYFEINLECILEDKHLSFNIDILNKSEFKMPINFGLHPYFNISDYQNLEFIEYSRNCQNQKNNCLEQTDYLLRNLSKGIDLLMYSSGQTSFKDTGFKRKITLINPSPFDICVFWSDPPRKMICMEPWTSPRNSLETGIKKIQISPYSRKKLSASIRVDNY